MNLNELPNIKCPHCKKGNIFKLERNMIQSVIAMKKVKGKLQVTANAPVFDRGFIYCVACECKFATYDSQLDTVELIE